MIFDILCLAVHCDNVEIHKHVEMRCFVKINSTRKRNNDKSHAEEETL